MTLLLQTFGSLGGAQADRHGFLGAGGHLQHADLNQLDGRSRLIRGVPSTFFWKASAASRELKMTTTTLSWASRSSIQWPPRKPACWLTRGTRNSRNPRRCSSSLDMSIRKVAMVAWVASLMAGIVSSRPRIAADAAPPGGLRSPRLPLLLAALPPALVPPAATGTPYRPPLTRGGLYPPQQPRPDESRPVHRCAAVRVAESANRHFVHRLPTRLDDYDGAPGLRHLVIVAGDLPDGLDGRRSRVLTGGATNFALQVPPGPSGETSGRDSCGVARCCRSLTSRTARRRSRRDHRRPCCSEHALPVVPEFGSPPSACGHWSAKRRAGAIQVSASRSMTENLASDWGCSQR